MKKRTFKSVFIMLLTLVCMFVMPVMSASAADATASGELAAYIRAGGDTSKTTDTNMYKGSNLYDKQGGGTYSWTDLVTTDGLVSGNFTNLTSSAKEELLTDMNQLADNKISDDETKAVNNGKKSRSQVTDQTKSNWLVNLQQCNGVGTQLMNTILQNTKPDYATANRIYEPFSGIVGTCLALGAILIMAFLGITMVLDLSYIGIPAFRMMVGGDDKGGKDGKPKFISWEAVSAVTQAEGGNGGSGQDGSSNKVAVGIYFKKRVIMLIVLGVCLLYLISGQIYTLVSWILDLVSGFLGF